ncbi:MAG: flagellar M-ring protein FliF [Synergistaceae bacterium]|jgi:flagellar M-ring protein FliF|nr:flagellar M-ring protein FliF [Synergistaceae bacterium]
MREYAVKIKEQLQVLWASLSRWQRISIVIAALLVSCGILALALVMGRTTYEPVFTGLEARDQETIIEYLKEQKISYRTDSSSNSILVPSANVYESRIALAAKGIPSGGIIGFERLDNSKIGRTSFQEKVDYYRALEGELARTIREMNAVSSARVSIVVPESKLFLEQQRPSTAAILLKLRPGAEFGQEQAKAVVHLVASSVEGLTSDNVTLVDADGQIPFDDILDDTLTLQTGNQLVLKQRQFEKQYELELERKLKDTLEKVYGPGRVKAAVRVELDFDKKQDSKRTVFTLPDKNHGPVQSEQNTEESYTGPAGITGGIPGTTTNIPGYVVNSGTAPGNAAYDRSDNVTNYDNSTHESSKVETQGKIKRLTATVLIDGTLEQPEIDNWRGAVATAIGADDDRGDRISIMAMPFDTSVADAYAARLAAERQRRTITGITSLVLLLAISAGLFAFWLRRRRRTAALLGAQEKTEDTVPSLRELLENPDLMTTQGELSVLEEQLRNYALNNPEELASLIKNWVVDDA